MVSYLWMGNEMIESGVVTNSRWMIRSDLNAVMEIENLCFEFPWKKEDFLACLGQRNCIGIVAEIDRVVAGYMLYEINDGFIRLLNIAVHPRMVRLGVGQSLINRLQSKLDSVRWHRITAQVRETNLDAQLFLRKMGFRVIAIQEDQFEETDEQAYLFQYRRPM